MPLALHPPGRHGKEHRRWPIRRSYLAALKDLGLSDPTIAQYFRVEPQQVALLRTSYGITEVEVLPARERRKGLFSWRRSA